MDKLDTRSKHGVIKIGKIYPSRGSLISIQLGFGVYSFFGERAMTRLLARVNLFGVGVS